MCRTLGAIAVLTATMVGNACGGEFAGDVPPTFWTSLEASLEKSDYDAFLVHFTPALAAKLGTGENERRRFEFALQAVDRSDFTAPEGPVPSDSGEATAEIRGAALPAAIGMAATL